MKHNKKTSLSDIPFKENVNDFGTDRYVNGLIKFIENSSAPLTIALQGEWGSGKTSMITRLDRALCGSDNAPFVGININTWEYSMLSSPELTVYKIVARLVRELTGKDSESGKNVSKILKVLYRGGREMLKMIPGINVAVEMANVPTEMPTEESEVSLAELRDELQIAVNRRIQEDEKQGVLIFVDDLDRLNPSVAVEILELLKNVFTLDNCLFVLAIDYDVVVKGLEPKFGKLTEKNEREFRSFFDKIIQVPFSLPVSSYRPMDFMLRALAEIGFLEDIDTSNPNVKTHFSAVVGASVGKNPRSIKRLINTLSLLECIAQCGSEAPEGDKDKMPRIDEKLLNFIIVAIQICYPQIYRLLVLKPSFTSWDNEFAQKEGIQIADPGENPLKWEDILDAACSGDTYLMQHNSDITDLFSMMLEILRRSKITTPESIGMKLKQILDKSSVTGVNAGFNAEDFDKKDLIYKLHNNVVKRIKQLRPDINRYQLKRNTGNGGIYIWYDDDASFDVVFTPDINKQNEISLRIWLDFHLKRPERMQSLTFDQMLQDEKLSSSIATLDSVLSPLLGSEWYFEGRTYDGQDSYFTSLSEELRYIHGQGWMSGDITNNPQYWINLQKPSHFENREIIDTIARVLIANYDFRKDMANWE